MNPSDFRFKTRVYRQVYNSPDWTYSKFTHHLFTADTFSDTEAAVDPQMILEREFRGINYDHCRLLHHRIMKWAPASTIARLGVGDNVLDANTDRIGTVLSIDEYVTVEFEKEQGKPVQLFCRDTWWHDLVKVRDRDWHY